MMMKMPVEVSLPCFGMPRFMKSGGIWILVGVKMEKRNWSAAGLGMHMLIFYHHVHQTLTRWLT